jgi:pimeloyl-ACP methyl ester carboxylesterase
MPYVEREGQRVFFEESGSGPPVVLGHSFLCSGKMWEKQVPALAETHRVVNIDFRGHGRSGEVSSRISLYDLVDDTLAVLDHLGIERAVWAGLSIGGMVAMRAALVAPQRVRGLVLIGTHAGAERTVARLRYGAMGFGTRLFGLRPLLPTVLKMMFGRTTHREQPELVRLWSDRILGVHQPSMLRCLAALSRRDRIVDRLADIAVPALVLVGEEDVTLPVPLSRQIDAALADSRLEIIPGAGHLVALERPDTVHRAMLDFLAGLPPLDA